MSAATCDEMIDVGGEVLAAAVALLRAEVAGWPERVPLLAAGSARTVLGAVAALRDDLARFEVVGLVERAHKTTVAEMKRAVAQVLTRLDAAVELARRSLHGAGAPSGSVVRGRGTPEVVVLIDHQTLVGQLACAGLAQLDDGTPISGAAARRLACEADILPVVLGGDSEILDLGRRRRLASVAQRRALSVRWRGCAFPGCTVPIGWAKAHHLAPWSRAGTTDHELLVPLCERHHHLVHEGGWRLTRRDVGLDVHKPDGTFFAHVRPPGPGPPSAPPGGGRGRGGRRGGWPGPPRRRARGRARRRGRGCARGSRVPSGRSGVRPFWRQASEPPSTVTHEPVTKEPASLPSSRAGPMISSGSARRFCAVIDAVRSMNSSPPLVTM
jgi:hypothetical protein